MAWISDKTSKNEDSTLNDTVIKSILTGKSYVKSADSTSFTTKKGEYEIPYSELYIVSETIPDNPNPTGDNTNFSALLYNYYKDKDYQQVEGTNIIDGTRATWLFYDEENGYPDYIEYKGGVYKIGYAEVEPYGANSVTKINSNVDISTFGVYQINERNILITPSTPESLVHTNYEYFDDMLLLDEEGINYSIHASIYVVQEPFGCYDVTTGLPIPHQNIYWD